MRCYLVTAKDGDTVIARRYAGTNALAKDTRDELVDKLEIKKKDVTVDQTEVPLAKDQLIEYLNALVTQLDLEEEGE